MRTLNKGSELPVDDIQWIIGFGNNAHRLNIIHHLNIFLSITILWEYDKRFNQSFLLLLAKRYHIL